MKGISRQMMFLVLALVVFATNLSGGGIASASNNGGQFQATTIGGKSYNCFYSNDAKGVPYFQGCLFPIQQPNGNYTSYYYYTYATDLNAQRLQCQHPQWVLSLYVVDQGSWRYVYDYSAEHDVSGMQPSWYATNGTSAFKYLGGAWHPISEAPNPHTYNEWLQAIFGVHSCS